MAGDLSAARPCAARATSSTTLAEAMNAMLDRLQQLMQTTRTAGDAIAHDLRSPLTRFRQKLEAALEAPPDSEADREALRKALDEADSVLDMFAAVLKLARVEAATQLALRARERDRASCANWWSSTNPPPKSRAATLKGEVEDGLVLSGEPGLFTQAVSNLIENALKYTPCRRARRSARRAPAGRAHRDRCARRWSRRAAGRSRSRAGALRAPRNARARRRASGLGLSLVAAVARLHQGRAALARRPRQQRRAQGPRRRARAARDGSA